MSPSKPKKEEIGVGQCVAKYMEYAVSNFQVQIREIDRGITHLPNIRVLVLYDELNRLFYIEESIVVVQSSLVLYTW